MIYWANLLHIYQPPGQQKEITQKVAAESYWRIIDVLKRHPKVKINLNINASLTEQLPSAGLSKLTAAISALARRGQIEFTGSAKYHVILALLPETEIIRQIELNNQTNKKFFGKLWQPTGFFIPELCYSKKVARVVKKMGFKWIVLDEIAYNGKFNKVKFDKKYLIKDVGLPVFFRNTRVSNLFFTAEAKTAADFFKILKKDGRSGKFLPTALDGENLGHHQKEMDKLYADLLDSGKFNCITFSDLLNLYLDEKEAEPIPSSWSSREEDLKSKVAYPLWKNPKNEIHRLEWQLTALAISEVNKNRNDKNYNLARKKLDQALHSDQYWWASANPWWSVKIILNGARMLADSLKLLKSISPNKKEKAENLYQKISDTAKKWQESGRAEKIKQAYLAGEPYERYFAGNVMK
ncbi:polysaccharide deacetylase family protein [Candidatus Falkowbacteria bacterium]|nr:polysaccharide deacetylase family protein [Candidatus Falkowbacteria bacterium]